jgi:hypothetical protein
MRETYKRGTGAYSMGTLMARAKTLKPLVGVIVASLIFTISPGLVLADVPFIGDAGTGVDAPDSEDQALLLSGPGTYMGTFASSTDADWYRLDSPAGVLRCLELDASSSAFAAVMMNADTKAASGYVTPSAPFVGALALKNEESVTIGFERLSANGSGVAGLDQGNYNFSLNRRTADSMLNGDAGTGTDAGPVLGQALAAPAPCFAGTVGVGSDHRDVYSIAGTAGHELTLSFEDRSLPGYEDDDDDEDEWPDVLLFLFSPQGDFEGYVVPGEAKTFDLGETGSWTMAVQETGSPTDYLIGIVDSDPPPVCRPTCQQGAN